MPPEPKAVAAGLYLVATPIGNLRDITLRALDVLAAADLVLAEDTRVTGKLLAAYGISAKLDRYDEHGARRIRPKVLQTLAEGGRIALVSDAGTPLISDPGYRLVVEAVAQGSAVFPIPGPSAVTAALTIAGLPTDRFLFAGFPPSRSAARRKFLEDLAPVAATLIFFESGARLGASLSDMAQALGPRRAAVARELTKLHETVIRGPLDGLAADPRLAVAKGEIVVLVDRGQEPLAGADEADAALAEALTRLGPAEAASEVAKALNLPRRELYARAIALRAR
ncbi:MAG TPA: 16S rRNA (cytidine(1402)-2'-O)-methyltransferase [Caulobacteraceae bacterium]